MSNGTCFKALKFCFQILSAIVPGNARSFKILQKTCWTNFCCRETDFSGEKNAITFSKTKRWFFYNEK